ncbi:hypothetical protein Sjap_008310 [Stephania japonica]|uniref:Uncharacterized protein n=1 Tax=Stephania japonica TaxID=461633 RepID=A0AAP0JQ18_9MAGN
MAVVEGVSRIYISNLVERIIFLQHPLIGCPFSPSEKLISIGLAELPSMTRPSPNSTPSSSTHHSAPSSSAGARFACATHDSPVSSTRPSTLSSAPPHLPNVEMPHAPAPPPELRGQRDVPQIRIIIKNGSLHPFSVCAQKMTDTFKKGMMRTVTLTGTLKLLQALWRPTKSKELGRDCTVLELYLHVHTKKHDGQTFIDARSERVNDEIKRMCEEMSQSTQEAGEDPYMDETYLYYKVVSVVHKGRVYGLGFTGRSSIVEDRQNQIQTQQDQIALLQSMLMLSMGGGNPGASISQPPPPPPSPSLQETPILATAVRTPALDVDDVYHSRMYEPEDEEQTNLAPLQQE